MPGSRQFSHAYGVLYFGGNSIICTPYICMHFKTAHRILQSWRATGHRGELEEKKNVICIIPDITISVMLFLVTWDMEGIHISLNWREANVQWTAQAVFWHIIVQRHACSSALLCPVDVVSHFYLAWVAIAATVLMRSHFN